MKKRRWIRGPLFALKIILIILLTSLVLMWLWNWLIPGIFNGPSVSYWQAIGIMLLSKLLFGVHGKGFRGGHHGYYPGGMWKRDFREKLEKMTPEEREKFKRNCRSSFYGCGKETGEEKKENSPGAENQS